jgi:hypothetical protein
MNKVQVITLEKVMFDLYKDGELPEEIRDFCNKTCDRLADFHKLRYLLEDEDESDN